MCVLYTTAPCNTCMVLNIKAVPCLRNKYGQAHRRQGQKDLQESEASPLYIVKVYLKRQLIIINKYGQVETDGHTHTE